jgi:hypothetical protein
MRLIIFISFLMSLRSHAMSINNCIEAFWLTHASRVADMFRHLLRLEQPTPTRWLLSASREYLSSAADINNTRLGAMHLTKSDIKAVTNPG